MTLGERIKRARKAARLSQTQLAKAVDVDQTTVSAWERGVGMTPRVDQATRLADALGVSGHWLVFGEGEGPAVAA